LENLRKLSHEVERESASGERTQLSQEKLATITSLQNTFDAALANDINMPQALAVVWDMMKSNIPDHDKKDLIEDFDEVLGLGLMGSSKEPQSQEIPQEILVLVEKRETFRKAKQFDKSDEARKAIEAAGYRLEDTSDGVRVRKG
jgi:cysteinyl-tRNA synthetase